MKSSCYLLSLPLLLANCLSAQVPKISNITVDNVGNTSLMVKYNISTDDYCQVKYGIVSGQYLWASESFLSSQSGGLSGMCWVPINGLAEGTTYYFLPTVRPNADNDTNICAASGCGSTEATATTVAGTAPHLPSAPAAVASWVSSYPDTSNPNYPYVTITLADGGAGLNHECVAASTVSAPTGYSWTVTAGATMTTIVNTVGFGTIIEVPEGLTCNVATSDFRNHGYSWPVQGVDPLATSIDDPNHRWIIVRTHANDPNDLPPFGYRAGPQFASGYGVFKASTPLSSSSSPVSFTGGSIWGATLLTSPGAPFVHHFWQSNLKFEVDETQSGAYWDGFVNFGAGPAINPQYIVSDRCWYHAPARNGTNATTPYIPFGFYGAIKSQFAFLGNYFDNFTWGSPVGIPWGIYMTDNTGGPSLWDNNYCDSMAMCFENETNYATDPEWMHDWTFTHNTMYWPLPQLSFAQYIHGNPLFGGLYACRNDFETKGVDKLLVAGNTFNGQWSCGNSGLAILLAGGMRDVTVRSNLIHRAASVLGINGQGNATNTWGVRFPSARILVENNLAYDLGRSLYDGGGPGLDSPYVEVGSPANDITIRQNTFGAIAAANWWETPDVQFTGTALGTMANFRWESNLFHFSTGGNPYWGGVLNYFGPGRMDNVLSHMPAPFAYNLPQGPFGQYAATLGSNSTKADGAPGLGISAVNVNQPGTGYANGAPVTFGGCTTSPAGTITTSGTGVLFVNITSAGSGCNPATMTAKVAGGTGAVLTPYYMGSPSHFWRNNVAICSTMALTDMDMATCAVLTGSMPAGNVFVSGQTTTERQANSGLLNLGNHDYSCTPTAQSDCHAGVIMNQIEAELGVVSQISATVSASAVQIAYLAPDTRACYVDLSTDGRQWTRQSDGGGYRMRSVPFVLGVSPATTYQYRILCYYPQDPLISPWFEFPADSSNLVTSGTVTTLTPEIGDPEFSFNSTDAILYQVTLTGIDGTQYGSTCVTSPCVVKRVPVGDYLAVWQYLNGTAVVRASTQQRISVR